MNNEIQIVLPSAFERPRYKGGMWLDSRRRWSDQDLGQLISAADMRLSPNRVADALGRAPTMLAHKAKEIGILLPKDWRALIEKKRSNAVRLLNLQYPYIVKPYDKNADLIAVNRLVSAHLPGREDVCQDIMLALVEARVSLQEMKNDPKAIRAFIGAFRKQSYERGGYADSLDVTLHSDDGRGKSKYEDAAYQRDLWNRYEDDFTELANEEITLEEIRRKTPAAFWLRATQ